MNIYDINDIDKLHEEKTSRYKTIDFFLKLKALHSPPEQLTLRDQFAIASLHVPFYRKGVLAEDRFNVMAEMAYKFADVMLKQRETKA